MSRSHRRRKRLIRRLLISAAIVVVILILGGSFLLRFWFGSPDPIEGQELPPAVSTEDSGVESEILSVADQPVELRPLDLSGVNASDALRQILRRHEEAIAGRAGVHSLISMRVEGDLYVEGMENSLPFSLTKKSPNMVRMEFMRDGFFMTYSYDGTTSWRRIQRGPEVLELEQLPNKDMHALIRHSSIRTELFDATTRGWRLKYTGELQYEGRKVYCIQVEGIPNEEVTFYIDQNTFLDTARVSMVRDENNEKLEQVVINDSFVREGSYQFPSGIKTMQNGQLIQRLEVNSIRVNPGLLSQHFSYPRKE